MVDTQASERPATETMYAWGDQPPEEELSTAVEKVSGGPVVAVGVLAGAALAVATMAAVVVLIAPTPLADHYNISWSPVQQRAPKPAPPAPKQRSSRQDLLQAEPPVHHEMAPSPPPAPSPAFDPARDQRLLNTLRLFGYTISDPPLVIEYAHQACRLFQQGESTDQVNQQMSAQIGTSMIETLELTSSAMLVYPNCY
jgi:hypothetical protein